MYCREVSNIVLTRSCSIYRCRELEKMYPFFQVCVGAHLADDHAHNCERVPLMLSRALGLLVACKHSRVIRPVLTQDHLPRNSFFFHLSGRQRELSGQSLCRELDSNDSSTYFESAADVNRWTSLSLYVSRTRRRRQLRYWHFSLTAKELTS